MGLVFTKGDLGKMRDICAANKVGNWSVYSALLDVT
jgi:hypothetical protein